MKTSFARLVSVLTILALCIFTSFSEGTDVTGPRRKLKMAYTDFAPFQEQTPDGPKGSLIEHARKIVQKAGYDLEMVYVPLKRMPSQLASGEVDIWIGMTHYPEFKGTTFTGNKTLLSLELMTYAFGKNIDIRSLDELKKYRLIIYSGYSYGGLLEEIKNPANKFTVIEVKDIEQAYRLLANNRADVFLIYKRTMEEWQKQRPALRMRGHLFKTVPVHIAVSRKAFEGSEVLKNLEAAASPLTDAP